jgi:hypothetical protein
MAFKNWHIRIEDSEITFIDKLLTGPDVESKIESDAYLAVPCIPCQFVGCRYQILESFNNPSNSCQLHKVSTFVIHIVIHILYTLLYTLLYIL